MTLADPLKRVAARARLRSGRTAAMRFIHCAVAVLSAAAMSSAAEKPRIYLTESGTTEIEADNIAVRKGVSPELTEVMKEFVKSCPGVIVNNDREKADFIVRFDREATSPTTPFVKGNKVAVFNRKDDLVYSGSARFLRNAVKSACSALINQSAR